MTNKQLQAGDLVTPAVRLVRPLAEGGMGRVWIAEHQGLHTQVVVKLMAPEMAERPDGAERFAREAAVCAAIKSPHVVQVFDHGVTDAGTPYIVMELLEGEDLGAHLVEQGRMDPLEVVAFVSQIGKALSKAHKASIVHRDIKPDNIFLCETEGGEVFAKLLDFGTARRETETSSRTTVPGQIMGTPYYMSPEQSVGAADIDERSDIWSLGVVAFEALTGHKPFDGASVGAITIAIHGPLPNMTDLAPELPAALDAWFARACAQLPGDRFATVREATDALVHAVTGAHPVDQPTESVCFPSVAPKKESTPVRPVTRPITPLSASLPERGSEKRFTTIAAAGVMGAAAIAMVAIVLGRSPAEPTPAEAPPTTRAAEMPLPPSAEPASAAANASQVAEDEGSGSAAATAETNGAAATADGPAAATGAEGAVAKSAAKGGAAKAPAAAKSPAAKAPAATKAPAAAKSPAAARPSAAATKGPADGPHVSAPSAAPARGSRAAPNDGADDELERLTNAASKHVPSDPPAPSAPPAAAATTAAPPSPSGTTPPAADAPAPPLPAP
ncbi:MAG: serine/threonine protein kinase [Labilithrix sp.]|nr:serine/threonine protein kinase [Labilithrix sp.]